MKYSFWIFIIFIVLAILIIGWGVSLFRIGQRLHTQAQIHMLALFKKEGGYVGGQGTAGVEDQTRP